MTTFKQFCANYDAKGKHADMAQIIALLDTLPETELLLQDSSKAVKKWLKKEYLDTATCLEPTLWLLDTYLKKQTYHGLDNAQQVFFYEQEFYVLSNFSSFRLMWNGIDFDTLEHAYHWEKFNYVITENDTVLREKLLNIQHAIKTARSAHDAYQISQQYKSERDPQWDDKKEDRMYEMIYAKDDQHPYVHKKLMETGTRRLIENSWRDSFWGWGPDGTGLNKLGLLWENLRQMHNNL